MAQKLGGVIDVCMLIGRVYVHLGILFSLWYVSNLLRSCLACCPLILRGADPADRRAVREMKWRSHLLFVRTAAGCGRCGRQ